MVLGVPIHEHFSVKNIEIDIKCRPGQISQVIPKILETCQRYFFLYSFLNVSHVDNGRGVFVLFEVG